MRGKYVFSIRGDCLDIEQIDNKIGFIHTKTVRAGYQHTERFKAKCDSWMYELSFCEENMQTKLDEFLGVLGKGTDYIQSLDSGAKSFDICIQSEYAQIGFSITGIQLLLISKLGLDVNTHILSFGMVE